ncbi:MAG: glycosyltransferase [Candidatus Cloacimonetes bacterium]|nr:glycosyltransferase [Candidatus Cloacimonadota bacterium]
MKLSFVIPVFNEEQSLNRLHREIAENVRENEYEIIFVDDGSEDGSFYRLTELAGKDKRIKVLKFRRNFGKAAALQAGFDYANGEIIFTLDADLQDNPREIPNFLDKLEAGYDLVTGWKRKRKDPVSKTLPSRFFNFVTSSSFGLKLHDYNCGFKAYRREVVKELDLYGEMHRYIPALAHARGFRVGEIPVEHRQREFGHSKYGAERYIRGFLDLLTVKLVTGFGHNPLHLFGKIGTTLSLIGFLTGLYLTVMKFLFDQPLANRPLLFLAVLLIMVGLQFFSIGLLGELIVSRTRDRMSKRAISISHKINI